MGGAYYLGNFIGSFVWGIVADKIGRRTVLLTGVCTIIGCELFFGFSQNMTWAVSARFLWGTLNGNVGVAKTYISEVSTLASVSLPVVFSMIIIYSLVTCLVFSDSYNVSISVFL